MGDFAQRVVESFGGAIFAIDARGDVALINDEARRLLALPADGHPLGRDCREVLRHEPRLASMLLRARGADGRLSRVELTLEGAAPGVTIGARLFPVPEAPGESPGAAVVFRDLAPDECAGERAQLQARLAALGRMTAGLAHELRNPLASMEVLGGLLLRRLGPEAGEERELALGLLARVRELTKIVSASLDFVRPGARGRSPCDPVDLVEAALERAMPKVSDAMAPLERRFARPLPPIEVDEEGMVSALANLIGNACEALETVDVARRRLLLEVGTGRGGRHDALDEGPGEVVISVVDSGPGVPSELREKVFDPFFTTRERGSGIGLATARKVVSGHGGCIELEEALGGGAIFRVRLPLADRG
jgi:signal transduction histidine kinase